MSSSILPGEAGQYRAMVDLHGRVLSLCQGLRRKTPAETHYAAALDSLLSHIGRVISTSSLEFDARVMPFLSGLERKLLAIPLPPRKGPDEDKLLEYRLSHDDMKEIMNDADMCLYSYIKPQEPDASGVRYVEAPPRLYVDTWGISRGPWKNEIDRVRNTLLLNPHLEDWIRPTEIQQWINCCDEQHGDHCGPTPKSDEMFPHRPRRLVDLERMCVVSAEPGCRYVALSYVWGTGSSLQSLKRNLDLLLADGSLKSHNSLPEEVPLNPKTLLKHATGEKAAILSNSLPPTIQHVFELVRNIGERYLWVDSLCIVQDEEDEKAEELSNMGSIYANAYFTIVAAGGTAYTGLFGVENVTPPMERPTKTPLYLVAPKAVSLEIEAAHRDVTNSMWSRRAWTFQEQIFSRRLLVLSEARITWECHCAVWFEGLDIVGGQCKKQRQIVPGLSFGSTASMQDYVKHVAEYNHRRLTYPEDALDAFSGILGTLTGIFVGGFVCGLPRMLFDVSLLWYNQFPLQVRIPTQAASRLTMTPSWAWAAWAGLIKFPEDKVQPLADWWYRASGSAAWEFVSGRNGELPFQPPIIEEDWVPHILYARVQRAIFKRMDMDMDQGIYLKGVGGEGVGLITASGQVPIFSDQQSFEVVAVSETSLSGELAINILWIEREGLTSYRRGVGRVLKSAWELQNPDTIELLLG